MGPVVRAPAQDALDLAAIVEVLREELATRRHVLGEEPPFENGPARRIHRRVNPEGHFDGVGPHPGYEQPATDDHSSETATERCAMHKLSGGADYESVSGGSVFLFLADRRSGLRMTIRAKAPRVDRRLRG